MFAVCLKVNEGLLVGTDKNPPVEDDSKDSYERKPFVWSQKIVICYWGDMTIKTLDKIITVDEFLMDVRKKYSDAEIFELPYILIKECANVSVAHDNEIRMVITGFDNYANYAMIPVTLYDKTVVMQTFNDNWWYMGRDDSSADGSNRIASNIVKAVFDELDDDPKHPASKRLHMHDGVELIECIINTYCLVHGYRKNAQVGSGANIYFISSSGKDSGWLVNTSVDIKTGGEC